jgi:hypothetical protein
MTVFLDEGNDQETGSKIMANRFLLQRGDLSVSYNVGGNPSFTGLSYTDGGNAPVNFPQTKVTTDNTAFGQLVSVELRPVMDTGGEVFGFFLPDVQLAEGQSQEVHTIGIRATFSGPDSFPKRPESWHSIELHGTAEEVFQPLAEEQPQPQQQPQ